MLAALLLALIPALGLAAEPPTAPAVQQAMADQTGGPPPGARVLAASAPMPLGPIDDYVALLGDELHVRVFTCPHCRRSLGRGFVVDLRRATPAELAPVLELLQLDPSAADWGAPQTWRDRAGRIAVGFGRGAVAGRWSDCGLTVEWSVGWQEGQWVLHGALIRGTGDLTVGALTVEADWSGDRVRAVLPRPPVAGDEARFTDERGTCSMGTVGPELWPPWGADRDADVALLLGGTYGPDHQGPKAWAAVTDRIAADPMAFARAVDAELWSPRADPAALAAWSLQAPVHELRQLDPAAADWLAVRAWGHLRAAALGRRGPVSDDQAERLAAAQADLQRALQAARGMRFGWSAVGWTAELQRGERPTWELTARPVDPEAWSQALGRAVTPTVYLGDRPADELVLRDGRLIARFARVSAGVRVPLGVGRFGERPPPSGLAFDGARRAER